MKISEKTWRWWVKVLKYLWKYEYIPIWRADEAFGTHGEKTDKKALVKRDLREKYAFRKIQLTV